jgi:hypothetical protein
MVLKDTTGSNGIMNVARFLTNTDTVTFTDADLEVLINANYHYFVNEILEAMDGWDFQGEIATADLVASQQEYVFPTDILKIKRVEVTYDGTNWYKAEFFDIAEIGTATDSTHLTQNFTQSNPFVDILENSIFLFPVPTASVTGGVKIWYEKEATELTNDSDTPVIATAYHKGLSYGAAKDYFQKYNDGRATTMENEMQKYIAKMKTFYNRKTQEQNYAVTPAFVDYEY